MKKFKFSIGVEKLVNPISVGTLHFLQSFSDTLPISMQKKIVESASKKNPMMGFIVEPYSYYLCYEIDDLDYFTSLLPDGFELVKTSVFDGDEEKYYFIISCYNVRTSAFFGNRIETNVIALNKNTNLMSWVILDYDTNTISYDSYKGLSKPTSDDGIITTDYDGQLIVDVQSNDGVNKLKFNSDIKSGVLRKMNQRLWVEGNISVAYSNKFSQTGDIFSLKFNPQEMQSAMEIDVCEINITHNNWYSKYLKDSPDKLVCFKYAQHFLSDSPGYASNLTDAEQLNEVIENTVFEGIEVYSSASFKRMIILLPIILMTIIIILIILLIVT